MLADATVRDHAALYRSILNSVPAQIAVLDRDGIIIYVNRSWQRFALENGMAPGEPALGTGVGVNYVAACQETAEFAAEGAATAREGIQQVLNGRLPLFEFEYPCHSPTQERWFSMAVAPLGADEPGVVIVHTDITERKGAEEKVRASIHELQVHQIELEMQNDELRRAQLELDNARARYFNLYDMAPVGYCSVSPQGLILETNFTAATLLGLERRDLVGQRMSRYIDPAHQNIFYRLTHQLVLSGATQSCELEMVNHNGAHFWAQLTAIIESEIDNVPTLRIAVSDITERKRAEEALREGEQRERERAEELEALLDAIPTPVFIAHDPDCLYITGNRAANTLLQIPRGAEASLTAYAESRPRHFKAVKDGSELHLNELPAQRAARGLPTQDFEFSLVFEQGETLRMLAYGAPLHDAQGGLRGAINVLVDVTKLKQAEVDLLRRTERLHGIIDSAMDAIISVDDNQNIVLFNAAAETIFGYSADQAIGIALSQLIPERFHAAHTAHLKNFDATYVTSRRMGSARRVVMGLRRNGEEFPVSATISEITESDGKLYTVVLRDVTEIRRAEEDLRKSQAQLREFAAAAQSIREQEKSRIARELHDELGQALTALKMDVIWLKQKRSTDHNIQDEKLEQMLSMVDDTVAATRRIASDLRPLILDDLGLTPAVEWLVAGFISRSGVACELEMSPPDIELPEPYATAVFRILQEALTNIARYAHAARVDIALSVDAAQVRVSVRDNGCGFDIAESTKPNSFGLMGLRERAHLLDGAVTIDSAPGQGTRIDVRIPIKPAPELT